MSWCVSVLYSFGSVCLYAEIPSPSTGSRSLFCFSRGFRAPRPQNMLRVRDCCHFWSWFTSNPMFIWALKFLNYTLFTGFLVFINLYCVKYGAIALQEIFDSIQPKQVAFIILNMSSRSLALQILLTGLLMTFSHSSVLLKKWLFSASSGCLAWLWRRS